MRRLVLFVVLAFAAPVAAESVAPTSERPQAQEDTTWRGPSGFWTNPRPAKGGAYRWRMMAIGGVVLLATGYAVMRLVRQTAADRAARGR